MERILLFVLVLFSGSLAAQCTDYLLVQYGSWNEPDVAYGSATDYQGNEVELLMNIYKPVGDGNTQRPLLVFIHGGGFTGGHRNDFNELCQLYAQRGYVAATISYRLGVHHIINPVFAVDHHELLRALYRGTQDARGAIRFLKGRSDLDSTDVNRVAVIGGSAGGFIAMHVAYMDQPEEKLPSSEELEPVFLVPRPDLGPIEGTLNLNGHNANVRAAVNIFGGMRDTSLITSAEDVPLYAYHQTEDPVVHCHRNKPYWAAFPDTNNPLVDGSCAIQAKTEELGFAPENAVYHIHDGSQHEVHDLEVVDAEMAAFLNLHLCPVVTEVDEISENETLIYPNPATDEIFVSANDIREFQLFSLTGKQVMNEVVSADKIQLDVASFPRGLYFLRLTFGNGSVSQHKLILK